jgi:hypothetical protein
MSPTDSAESAARRLRCFEVEFAVVGEYEASVVESDGPAVHGRPITSEQFLRLGQVREILDHDTGRGSIGVAADPDASADDDVVGAVGLGGTLLIRHGFIPLSAG